MMSSYNVSRTAQLVWEYNIPSVGLAIERKKIEIACGDYLSTYQISPANVQADFIKRD